ncbi:hypothetical protein NQ314_018359 [Rhamnusium bicolor]|uniref:Uncharacterized protein n=1 Tax=Rhamnusium bicolor TaxID=1586634 RepID=A0AAV8WSK5_9CUCU|nr:hypothetical protein NQ314_018359 [Rhamnusium bicolor]
MKWDDDKLDSAESINFTLFPPDQDEDTDLDEASDEVIAENDIHDLGKGILGQTSHVQIVAKNSEKYDLVMSEESTVLLDISESASNEPDQIIKSQRSVAGQGERDVQDEYSDSEDDIPLSQIRLKILNARTGEERTAKKTRTRKNNKI